MSELSAKDERGSEEDETKTSEDHSSQTVKQEPPDVADDKELGGESNNKPECEELKVREDKDQVEETPNMEVKKEPQDERHQEIPAKVEGHSQDEKVVEGHAPVKTESEERQSRSPSSESSPSETAAAEVAAEAAPLLQEEDTTATGGNAVEQGMQGHTISITVFYLKELD